MGPWTGHPPWNTEGDGEGQIPSLALRAGDRSGDGDGQIPSLALRAGDRSGDAFKGEEDPDNDLPDDSRPPAWIDNITDENTDPTTLEQAKDLLKQLWLAERRDEEQARRNPSRSRSKRKPAAAPNEPGASPQTPAEKALKDLVESCRPPWFDENDEPIPGHPLGPDRDYGHSPGSTPPWAGEARSQGDRNRPWDSSRRPGLPNFRQTIANPAPPSPAPNEPGASTEPPSAQIVPPTDDPCR